VLVGVPVGMQGVLSTAPYYRSTYVFVTRRRDHLQITSFRDPQLNTRRIGLQVMEEDLSPPSLSLVRSGHAGQLVGYNSFGREAGNILRALNSGEVGAAVVWGPLAGYYAHNLNLDIRPVSPPVDHGIPFVFDIAMGVHVHDRDMRDQLSSAITREAAAINRVLGRYGVPLAPDGGGS
jgi:mxaJ protein